MYYTLTTTNAFGQTENNIVLDNENGTYTIFPADPTNPNYPAYQAWLDEGNTPEPFPGF
jgi:hypothetical protein